jgi:hypothetical protein
MKKTFHIRVDHSLGFFSFYDVEAEDYHDAEKEAMRIFNIEFCGGGDNTTIFRGVKEQHSLSAFTFDKFSDNQKDQKQ